MVRIGLIINPIAGMGGRVGLKGTDGLADQARALGARPLAGEKTLRALGGLAARGRTAGLCLVAPPGKMGGDAARAAGLPLEILDMDTGEKTQARDTVAAAREMVGQQVDLILFAGGDGTARDVCEVVGESLPVIGIPAGVKLHSPVFAVSPEAAGGLARAFAENRGLPLVLKEVMDLDEAAYRSGQVAPKLFGHMKVPRGERIQGRKSGSALSEAGAQSLICMDYGDRMDDEGVYLIGPGTTTRGVMTGLDLPHSLLGVDVVSRGQLLAADASERQILDLIRGKKAHIFITPIGGQGHLFGRGNHQLSPEVIRAVGKDNICIGATLEKIGSLRGRPFRVDTGDPGTDRMLAGYVRVITGFRQEMVYPVA